MVEFSFRNTYYRYIYGVIVKVLYSQPYFYSIKQIFFFCQLDLITKYLRFLFLLFAPTFHYLSTFSAIIASKTIMDLMLMPKRYLQKVIIINIKKYKNGF